MGASVVMVHGAALVLRVLLVGSSLSKLLQARPEVSTPVNSFKRLSEGVALHRDGISPYSGDNFHEQPIMLYLFTFLMTNWPALIPYLFIAGDHLAAWFLGRAATSFLEQLMKRQRSEIKRKEKTENENKNDSLLVRSMDVASAAVIVQVCYLFNPFGIASCIAMTSSVFHNFIIAAALLAFQIDRPFFSASLLALVSLLGLYPAVLIVPTALHYATGGGSSKSRFDWTAFCSSIAVFCSVWAAALYMIVTLSGSWQFFQSTYFFLILVPDLTPTVGVFWYFFTEVFDHFRLFFLWVFQLNIFIFVIPLTLTLRRSPMLLFHVLLILIAVFKPYPSVGDAVVYMALLPIWRHLYMYIRHSFVAACTMAVFAVLSPVMWKLWIQDGSANANFYFAITLAYSTAQIFLLTDLLYAELRHRIHMTHGVHVVNETGNEAKITLS